VSKTAVYNWLEPTDDAIALSQAVGANLTVTLNGNLSELGNPIVTLKGLCRKLSISSGDNVSAINFTIVGTYLGQTISETIAGPNATSVETTSLFHTISSITTNTNTGADTVSIGTGSDGHTVPYQVDFNSDICAISAHAIVTSGIGDITYSFDSSLQDMDVNFSVTNGAKTMYNMSSATSAVTIGAHGMLAIEAFGSSPPDYIIPVYAPTPIKWCWVDITGSLSDPASMLIYIQQQGIV
jgi:hypothetical protein